MAQPLVDPEGRMWNLTIRLPPTLHRALEAAAVRMEEDRTSIVRGALAHFLVAAGHLDPGELPLIDKEMAKLKRRKKTQA